MITTLSFDLDDTLWDPRPALVAANKAQWLALECQPLRFISGDEGWSWIPECIVKIE